MVLLLERKTPGEILMGKERKKAEDKWLNLSLIFLGRGASNDFFFPVPLSKSYHYVPAKRTRKPQKVNLFSEGESLVRENLGAMNINPCNSNPPRRAEGSWQKKLSTPTKRRSREERKKHSAWNPLFSVLNLSYFPSANDENAVTARQMNSAHMRSSLA